MWTEVETTHWRKLRENISKFKYVGAQPNVPAHLSHKSWYGNLTLCYLHEKQYKFSILVNKIWNQLNFLVKIIKEFVSLDC